MVFFSKWLDFDFIPATFWWHWDSLTNFSIMFLLVKLTVNINHFDLKEQRHFEIWPIFVLRFPEKSSFLTLTLLHKVTDICFCIKSWVRFVTMYKSVEKINVFWLKKNTLYTYPRVCSRLSSATSIIGVILVYAFCSVIVHFLYSPIYIYLQFFLSILCFFPTHRHSLNEQFECELQWTNKPITRIWTATIYIIRTFY